MKPLSPIPEFLLCILCGAIFSGILWGEEQKTRQEGLLFAGNFEKTDIESNIKGARKTKLAAAYTWKYGVRLFTDKTWDESGLKWESFAAKAGTMADQIAARIKPTYIRNHRGVIDYAIIKDEAPFLSSVITSPAFRKPFIETLGDKLHVIVLDRNVLYVFPATGRNLAEFGPALAAIYKKTPMPVSLEIFQIDKRGYRVIGEIERSP